MNIDTLTPEEKKRYSRHLVLRDFGVEGQVRLKHSSVLVVGAGGLGSPVLLYLAAAGVGTIGIADSDRIELSNLQRQVLFTVDDVGKEKSIVAVERLGKLNPLVTYKSYAERLTSANAIEITAPYDLIVDGSDNFATRYLMNDVCLLTGKPLVYGSILKFEGQVAVFNLKKPDGRYSSNYRDLFAEPPGAGAVLNCQEAGVIGVLPGIIGSLMANEAIKILSGTGVPASDRLTVIDAETMTFHSFVVKDRGTRETVQQLIDYDQFCGNISEKSESLPTENPSEIMKELTVEELKELKDSGADFQLIDVREPHEFDICNLEGELIPMSQIPHEVDKISKDKQVVVYCRSGRRSGDAILWLERNHQFNNLYNLKGGILAWAREIDPDMPTY